MRSYAWELLWNVVAMFVQELPELERAYREHLAEYGDEPLAYIFFPDAVRDLERQLHEHRLSDDFYERSASLIEKSLISKPESHDLICLGLLDEIKTSTLWELMRYRLGPKAIEAPKQD